jgi:hypothetical protein
MDFQFDDLNNFSAQHVSPSGRTPASTNYTPNFYPHEPCSYSSNPYHSSSNCPSLVQFSNFAYEQMNTNFSNPGFDSNSNVYNPNRSNHPDFSWQAQAMRNCAPQYHELHYPEYLQFDDQSSHPSSYNYPASSSQSTLEDTLKAFMQITVQAIERLGGQFDRLVAELNRMEEEEFQSQLMVERHYMADENESSNLHHKHVQAATTLGSEEVVEEIVNKPSLEDPLEESFAQFEFDMDLDMISEQANALLDSTPEVRPENGETTEISSPDTSSSAVKEEEKEEHLESVEHLEQIESP